MATSDLARELSDPNLVLDTYNTKRVIEAVLHQLNDTSGDISALANKWYDLMDKNFQVFCLEKFDYSVPSAASVF